MLVYFTKKTATEKALPSLCGGKVSRVYQMKVINPIIAPQVPLENFQYLGAGSNSHMELLISNHDDYVTQLVRTNRLIFSAQMNSGSIQRESAFEIPEASAYFYCVTDFVSQAYSVFVPENKIPFHASDGMLDYYSCL